MNQNGLYCIIVYSLMHMICRKLISIPTALFYQGEGGAGERERVFQYLGKRMSRNEEGGGGEEEEEGSLF